MLLDLGVWNSSGRTPGLEDHRQAGIRGVGWGYSTQKATFSSCESLSPALKAFQLIGQAQPDSWG